MYHYILSDFTIVFLVIICLLVGSNIIFWCFPNYIKNRKIKQFVLYENGLIDFEFQSNLKLHANSRIGWFGCWLVLANESSEVYAPTPKKPDIHLKSVIEDIKSRKPIKMFFFKDSLSELDYSRLSRQILSNHR